MSDISTNTIKALRWLPVHSAGFFAFIWLVQLIFDHNQISYQLLAVVAVAIGIWGFVINLLLPVQMPLALDTTPFDRKSLRQALHIASGIAAGSFISGYSRHHGEGLSYWALNATIGLVGGFVGGYGPIKLTRALTAFWRNRTVAQIQGSN